jgi:uncharacterized protein (DUF1778 family)
MTMAERDPDQQTLDEIERQIADGTDLDGLTPVKAKAARNPRAVVSIRVPPDAFDIVARAAEHRGVSVSEFFRDAAMSAAAHELTLDRGNALTAMEEKLEDLLALVNAAKSELADRKKS